MNNNLISKVFRYLGIGLLVTFIVAYLSSISIFVINFIYSGSTVFILGIIQIILAIFLSIRINKMSSSTAKLLYFGYAALTGFTLSSIFIIYELISIIYVFLATAIIFLIFSFIGKSTKIDLSKFGIYLFIGLISIIILKIINMFILNGTLDMLLCIVSLIIFIGYIAYDMQKIIKLNNYTNGDNIAIFGAFQLYLDIINIFIELLRIFGDEK